MKDDCTTLIVKNKKSDKKNFIREIKPSESTLAFLKLFARNYQVESKMPEGLQGMILS